MSLAHVKKYAGTPNDNEADYFGVWGGRGEGIGPAYRIPMSQTRARDY